MASPRRGGLLLLIAILPTLTYFGHWPVMAIDIPGTSLYVQLPGSEGVADDHHAAGGQETAHDHAQHCHGDAATCTDLPFTGASAFALMAASLAGIGLAGLLTLLALRWWEPGAGATIPPELRPPQRSSLLPA